MMICQHAPHVQVFQPDELVFFNQHSADLVVKVAALIGNMLVQTQTCHVGTPTGVPLPHFQYPSRHGRELSFQTRTLAKTV